MLVGVASVGAVGEAFMRKRTVPVAVFSWQLGVLVEIEPPGLETNTKQLLLQLKKLRQKSSAAKKHARDARSASRYEVRRCMEGPRWADYVRGR